MATAASADEIPTEPSRTTTTGRKGRRRQQRFIPTDRSTPFPAALLLRDITEQDEESLVQQLGYLPGNVVRIPARVADVPFLVPSTTVPVVAQLYPLVLRQSTDGPGKKRKRGKENKKDMIIEPFPTTYWLTHPSLHTSVSQLEGERFGSRCEQRLQDDPSAADCMRRANKAYGQERWNMIDTATREQLPFPASALDATRGVAGTVNFLAVKCLHAHTAHALSGGAGADENVIGKWVLEELAKRAKSTDNAESSNSG